MNLISKKDLLAVTGISYGQLYRWKRQRLIPEEWFIKQSSYTGQETFFPREQILSRVQSIQELKDRYSLDELADILSPQSAANAFTHKEVQSVSEIDPTLIAVLPQEKTFPFQALVFLAALSTSSLPNEARTSLAEKALSFLPEDVKGCIIFLADGCYHLAFSHGMEKISFDSAIEVVESFSLEEYADKLKMKYKNLLTK